MNAAQTFTGACLCGAVGFALRAPMKWCAHCHCTMCRRAHGAAIVTWVGVVTEQFTLVRGDAELRWYRSSPPAERGFCSRCGSTLFFRSERWPGEVHVVLANLDDPLPLAPQAHVFWGDHVEWLTPADDLPRLGAPGGAG